MTRKTRLIRTMGELERLLPKIVKAVNEDQDLAMRAAANPILALEEMGYTLDDELRRITERRVRFPKVTAEKMNRLAEEVYRHAEERFDLSDENRLAEILFRRLELRKAMKLGLVSRKVRDALEARDTDLVRPPRPVAFSKEQKEHFTDPLEIFHGKHPIIGPLLEYRRIDAGEPRFAPPEVYERIRSGELKGTISNIRVRITRKISG